MVVCLEITINLYGFSQYLLLECICLYISIALLIFMILILSLFHSVLIIYYLHRMFGIVLVFITNLMHGLLVYFYFKSKIFGCFLIYYMVELRIEYLEYLGHPTGSTPHRFHDHRQDMWTNLKLTLDQSFKIPFLHWKHTTHTQKICQWTFMSNTIDFVNFLSSSADGNQHLPKYIIVSHWRSLDLVLEVKYFSV